MHEVCAVSSRLFPEEAHSTTYVHDYIIALIKWCEDSPMFIECQNDFF